MFSFVSKEHVIDDGVRRTTEAILKNCGGNIRSGLIYNNFDGEQVTGIVTEHLEKSAVVPELIHGNAFEYLCVVPINVKDNPHIVDEHDPNFGEKYFMGRKKELDELVPQYAKVPPSLKNRNRNNSKDTRIVGVELGQYGGRVGVYKVIAENGEEYHYFLVASGGAQLACEELSKMVKEKVELVKGIQGPSMTHEELVDDKDFGYARYVARYNVLRTMYNAASALGIKVPSTLYKDVEINPVFQVYPSFVIPARTQTMNTISDSIAHCVDDNETISVVGICREVVPASEVRTTNQHYVAEGPADPIYLFDTNHPTTRNIQNGLPCTTGRNKPLPLNIAAVNDFAKTMSQEQKNTYDRRAKHVFWENAPNQSIHPDVVPGTFNRLITKNETSFVDHLFELGLHKKAVPDRLIPVIVKISNPYLIRPQIDTTVSATTKSPLPPSAYDYDE